MSSTVEYYSAVKNEVKNVHEIEGHRIFFIKTRRTLRETCMVAPGKGK